VERAAGGAAVAAAATRAAHAAPVCIHVLELQIKNGLRSMKILPKI